MLRHASSHSDLTHPPSKTVRSLKHRFAQSLICTFPTDATDRISSLPAKTWQIYRLFLDSGHSPTMRCAFHAKQTTCTTARVHLYARRASAQIEESFLQYMLRSPAVHRRWAAVGWPMFAFMEASVASRCSVRSASVCCTHATVFKGILSAYRAWKLAATSTPTTTTTSTVQRAQIALRNFGLL